MEYFQQTVIDLFGIYFPEDLYTELIKFIPSKYVNHISNGLGKYDITVPIKYIECDLDALFHADFIHCGHNEM